MRAHVQNPWTRSPSLMVNLSVEEATQLEAGLALLKEAYIQHRPPLEPTLSSNQEDALNQLRILLEEKLKANKPDGLNGAGRHG